MLVPHFQVKSVINQLKYFSLWGILVSSLIACQASPILIEQVSQKQIGKTVYLTGKVVHLAPFVDNAAYQLADSTGKIWVVTQELPQLGKEITIKGKIKHQSLPFEGQELGDFYLIELEQSATASQ